MLPPSTDEVADKIIDAGFEAFEKVEDQLEAAKNVAGAAGDPRAFTVLIDLEADGSTEESRTVELYVFGNMPSEMLDSVLALAVKRYRQELARGTAG